MSARFLHYDQAALDREYDNRAKVADFQGYLDRYIASSAAARQRHRAELDIAYGPSPTETLDVFRPEHGDALPINLFIHGGYWKALSKNEFSFVADGFVARGSIAVVIDYGLIPAVTMAELVRQCQAACAWVWQNAERLGGDPQRLYVSGHSAGGHLSAMMMATEWPAFAPGLPENMIRGACAISGLYDLVPIQRSFLNEDLRLSDEDVERFSPVRLPRRGHGPLLLPLGALEGPEYLRQSAELSNAWAHPSAPATVHLLDRQDHFSIVAQLGDPDSTLIHRMRTALHWG